MSERVTIRSVRVGDMYVSRGTSTICKAHDDYDDTHIIVRRREKSP